MKLFRFALKRGWDLILNNGRQINRKPGFLFGLLFLTLDRTGFVNRITSGFSVDHYLSANRLPADHSFSVAPVRCELLVVATLKDFYVLPLSVRSAIKSQTSLAFTKINIVVPEEYLLEVEKIVFFVEVPITLICENVYFADSEAENIEKHFKHRAGWVKQQLIKIRHISDSGSDFTLVLDSDTLLLRNRCWIDQGQKQILFQSEEFNPEYYDFLTRMGGEPSKRFSFITHYMLFNRGHLIAALSQIGMSDSENQIRALVKHSKSDIESAFSIDFELYGQFLLKNDLCTLRKWSHIDIAPKSISIASHVEETISKLSKKWSSASIHSWRNR